MTGKCWGCWKRRPRPRQRPTPWWSWRWPEGAPTMSLWSWRGWIEARRTERRLLMAGLWPCCALIALARWAEGGDWPRMLGLAAGYGLLFAALHLLLGWVRPSADQIALPLVAVLAGIALALLARLDGAMAVRQLGWLTVGGAVLLVLSAGDPTRV